MTTAGARAAWHAYQHRRSEHWTTSYGTCTLTEVTSKNDSFRVRLLYSYNVPGERYALAGEFEKDFNDEDEARQWAEGLREQTIPVRYNPGKPATSVLWDSELANVVAGNPVLSKPTPPSHQPLESWERMFFPGLIVLSATGLAVSLAVHVAAIAGVALVSTLGFFALHAACIVLFFPAAKGTNQQGHSQSLDVAIKSWPEWVRISTYFFFYYAIFNFLLCLALFFMKEPGYGGFENGAPSPELIRWFSGHWMLFFVASSAMMYMRLRSGADGEAPSRTA
ncbi:MAG: DUF3592 domain-containing protein [Acidobacteriia bacterium]|nr:DUF3592 domain-containing protein [Terriglobia bacterium]